MPEVAIWIGLCTLIIGTWIALGLRSVFRSRKRAKREDDDLAEFLVNADNNYQAPPFDAAYEGRGQPPRVRKL